MNAEEMKALGHRIAQAWNEGNLQIIDEVYAPDYVNHHTGEDRETLKQAIEAARAVSADLRITQGDFTVEGNRLVFRWTLRGTYASAHAGVPATSKRIELRGLRVARVKNGQVVEEWSRGDDLGLLRQMGALP